MNWKQQLMAQKEKDRAPVGGGRRWGEVAGVGQA